MSHPHQPSPSTRTCAACPKLCRFVCPVAETTRNERHTPWGKQTEWERVLTGRVEWTRERSRTFYACADCRASRSACLHGIEATLDLQEARKLSVAGKHIDPAPSLLERFQRTGDPMGRAASPRPRDQPESDCTLFPGCEFSTELGGDWMQAWSRVATAAGFAWSWPTPNRTPLCGGYPLQVLGYEAAFQEHRIRLGKLLEGRPQITVACPACLPIVAAIAGPASEVVAPVDLLDRWIGEGRLSLRKRSARITYHDPCHLGRVAGSYDPPRTILSTLFEEEGLVEMPSNRANSRCCGGGGGLPATYPKVARSILETRRDEARSTNASLIATACPTCRRRLGHGNFGIPTHDLVELVAEALEP